LTVLTTLKVRIPKQPEWIWAQAAGPNLKVPPEDRLPSLVWYADNSKGAVHPSGERPANTWGFHDLLGNVAEWAIPASGGPVLMGGSWKSQVWDLGEQTLETADPQTAGFRILVEF
jgi:hypothetical protein